MVEPFKYVAGTVVMKSSVAVALHLAMEFIAELTLRRPKIVIHS